MEPACSSEVCLPPLRLAPTLPAAPLCSTRLGQLHLLRAPPHAPRRQYQDFRIGNDGSVSGVGMMIAADPSGKMVVLAPIKGSPAEAAGIQPGDEVGGAWRGQRGRGGWHGSRAGMAWDGWHAG